MVENTETVLLLKSGLIFTWLALFFILERLFSTSDHTHIPRTRQEFQRLARNISLWLGNSLLSPLVVLPLSLWATTVSLNWRPLWWGGGLGVMLDLLLLDLWVYWWHRANHKISWLWRFHQIHHLDERMDVTTALRFHFGEIILSALLRVVIICALGLPLLSIVIFETLLMLSAIFHHSDLRMAAKLENGLARFIITPSIHWVHHHAIRADTDSNYGAILSCWDRLFTSKSATVRSDGMIIGVENESDQSLVSLLFVPFKPPSSGARNVR